LLSSSVGIGTAAAICLAPAAIVAAWFYAGQLRRVRSDMRNVISQAFRGERPPITREGRPQLARGRPEAGPPRSGPHPFSSEADEKDGRSGPPISSSAGARHRPRVGRGACSRRAGARDPAACRPADPGGRSSLLPLQVGIWGALLALLRPGAEPKALARALRAYTRSTGYFIACARKDAMRHDLEGRAVEPVSEEHRTGAVKAVQGRRRRSAAQQGVGAAAA